MSHKRRITIETLRSGQPRAYADSEHVVRVTFEVTKWDDSTGRLSPDFRAEERVREDLIYLKCGFGSAKEKSDPHRHGLESYLDYLRAIDPTTADALIPGGDPNKKMGSVWEFRVVTPFND